MNDASNREVTVLSAALELRPAERSAYLDQACAGDAALRQQVEALLQAHEQAEDFLDTPPDGLDFNRTSLATPPLSEKPGDRIGRYKLLQQIGEGGCGVVYMAEQEEPVRRRVALKVIKLGMDTRQVIARFEAERQALAMMDHPHIARVIDAGASETGRPYFVMELVRGIKITDFCDENKLQTADRLKLFIQVCQAIQHAHQKGVIHRDIKPSNILVTVNDGVPVPKVIDFGIAKATAGRLTDHTLFTAFEQFIGTPAYMSPEQAVMTSLDIDTRTDIYSLGVLLYELLTGRTPFDQKELLAAGLDEMRRTIREVEPMKPSTRLRQTASLKPPTSELPTFHYPLSTDLDWIVMKCLEKDRGRRYETANGLAKDVQRHLDCEPVVARPPSRLYEFQKTVRRHKLGFGAASAVGGALVLGMAGSAWEATRARRAENEQIGLRQQAQASQQKSQTEAARATAVSDFLQDMLRSVHPDSLNGPQYTVRQLLDAFSANLGARLADQPEVEATLRSTIGNSYVGMDRNDLAEPHLARALALRRRLFGDQSEEVAQSLVDHAWVLSDRAASEAEVRQALKIYESRSVDSKPVIHALWVLQLTLMNQGRFEESEAAAQEALARARRTPGRDFPEIASVMHGLAGLWNKKQKYKESEALAYQAVEMHRRLHGTDHPETAWGLAILGDALKEQDKLAEAAQSFRQALEMFLRYFSINSDGAKYALRRLRETLAAQGDFGALEALEREVLDSQRKVVGNQSPALAETLTGLAVSLYGQGKSADADRAWHDGWQVIFNASPNELPGLLPVVQRLSRTLKSQGKPAETEKLFEEAIEASRQRLGGTNLVLGQLLHEYGEFLWREGKLETAAEYYVKALAIRRSQPDEGLAWTLNDLGEVLVALRRPNEAELYHRQALALYGKLHAQADVGGTAWISLTLGNAFYEQRKLPDAEQAYRDALAIYSKCQPPGSQEYARTVHSLLVVLNDEHKLAEAKSIRAEWAERLAPSELNGFAWLLATACDPNLRDGTNALFLAEKAVAATSGTNAGYLDTLAAAYAESSQFTNAISVLRESIMVSQSEQEKRGLASRLKLYETGFPYRDHGALAELTRQRLVAGRFAEAEPLARQCLAIREIEVPDDWRTFNARSMLGGALLGQKRYVDAEPFLLSGYEGLKERENNIPPEGKTRVPDAIERLVQLYEETSRPEKATEWKKKLALPDRTEN